MPRLPRVVVPGEPHHLIQRGNNRTSVFLAPEELTAYRALLQAASAVAGCAIHAYVLMTNHVHLLVTPGDASGAARLMKELSQGYARWFNRRHRRTGTLWEGRYRSAVVDSDRYLLACHRYIELNPVRAKMVAHAADYTWSSVRSNGWGAEDPLLTPHPCYAALGASPAERQAAYRGLLASPFDEAVLAALRRATHTRTAVGADAFVGMLASQLQRPLPPGPHGGDRRSEAFRGTPRARGRAIGPA